jgi:hypothetical protein
MTHEVSSVFALYLEFKENDASSSPTRVRSGAIVDTWLFCCVASYFFAFERTSLHQIILEEVFLTVFLTTI